MKKTLLLLGAMLLVAAPAFAAPLAQSVPDTAYRCGSGYGCYDSNTRGTYCDNDNACYDDNYCGNPGC